MKKLLFFALIIILTGCAQRMEMVAPKKSIVDIPERNTQSTVEIGEPLVKKANVYTRNAIKLQNTVSAGDGFFLKKFTQNPAILPATRQDNEWICYGINQLEVYDVVIGTVLSVGGLAINKFNEEKFRFCSDRVIAMEPTPKPIIIHTEVVDYSQPGFEQELLYNGRSGDVLKFLYREYQYNKMRGDFTQEIQYDLKDGNLIGFKGVRLEILNASNTKITYKVISSFPEPLF